MRSGRARRRPAMLSLLRARRRGAESFGSKVREMAELKKLRVPEGYGDYWFGHIPPVPVRRDGTTALLIIDMQYHCASANQGLNFALDKIDPGSMDYFNNRNETLVIPTIAKLLGTFREHRLPVIYVTLGSYYRDLRDLSARFRRWIRALEERTGVEDIFWSGSPLFATRKEIAPLPDETIVHKTTTGAFNGSNIDQVLQRLGIETLIITGVSTNECVETTARDAADRGYGCIIVDEGTVDYNQEAHDASLRVFQIIFGHVLKRAEDVIEALATEAEVPGQCLES